MNLSFSHIYSDADNLSMSLVLVIDLLDGLLGEVIKRDVIGPAPVVLGVRVIKRAWPCFRDGLSEVGRILNGEVRDVLLNCCRNLLRREAYAGEVIHTASQLGIVCVQEVNGSLDAVVYVDHGEESLRLQEALVVSIFKGLEEDFYNL